MPCNVELSGIESYLFTVMSRECIMRTYVNQIKNHYDYILIDCTPSLGLLPINAFVAADSIIVPSQPRILSTKGLDMIFFKPRTWCAFCPMGTMTQAICKLRNRKRGK